LAEAVRVAAIGAPAVIVIGEVVNVLDARGGANPA
jgi:siroheme synthase